MKIQKDYRPLGCRECAGGAGLAFEFTMAFQPIVNTTTKELEMAQTQPVSDIDGVVVSTTGKTRKTQ